MATTYVFGGTDPKDLVRLLIPDKDFNAWIFEDEEINAFLSLEGSDVRRATALALETIASNEAMIQKVIILGDLETDGAKLMDSLMKRAAALRTQAATQATNSEDLWDAAEIGWNAFSQRDIYVAGLQRAGF